ncbi:unnamed protein product [Enterobius vermicularis]|uniref:Ubiquitin-like domain-containing protein n=1 Tax=Enterobius vermicularis TaxID=51028 RepID=A0A0N4V827_ENTVE|nr:unnamed protein product [Enterobius vermicularis]
MSPSEDDCSIPSSSARPPSLRIFISSVTGQKWVETISEAETVQTLKSKIWRRCGLLPYHQGLIFGNNSLPDGNDRILLKDLGIRADSLVRLVLVTRSGPMAIQHTNEPSSQIEIGVSDERCSSECWDGGQDSSEDFLEENRRTLFKMCELRRQMRTHSSARPSSEHFLLKTPVPKKALPVIQNAMRRNFQLEHQKRHECFTCRVVFWNPIYVSYFSAELCEEEQYTARDTALSARDRLLVMMHSRAESPSTDVNAPSEDGSEFSSGMVVCDLTNEFRRLRVRRRHHVANSSNGTQKTHVKAKPKPPSLVISNHHNGSDITSSDDEMPSLRRTLDNACSNTRRTETNPSHLAFRRLPSTSRGQRMASGFQSQHRCYTCSSRFNNYSIAFHCRCGKRLCSRHRPAEMHTCSRLRKMQDVSD